MFGRADFLYLLSYAGTGSQPDQYFIDVFNPNGTPLVTNSPGTNVPHLASVKQPFLRRHS